MMTENYCLGCDTIQFYRLSILHRIIGMYLPNDMVSHCRKYESVYFYY